MVNSNFKCEKCGHVWTEWKDSCNDEFNVTKCPNTDCNYELKNSDDKTIYRKWGISNVSVCEGKLGNASNGYTTGDIYIPDKFSTGKRFKNSAMYGESALNLPERYYVGD